MAKKTYGVGIVGCGEVWGWHREAFDHLDCLRCVAVYDPDAARQAAAAAATGAREAASADAVLTDPDVDIAAILTPVFTHADMVETATGAGKHLMLEKPMAVGLAEGQRIVDAISNAGVKCFHPTLRSLSSDLFTELEAWTADDGPVGPESAAFYHLVGSPFSAAGWLTDRSNCLPIAEYDPHVLDTFLTLTGDEPESVWCHAGRYCRSFDQDDVMSMIITFRDQRFLQIDVHWVMDPAWQAPGYVNFDIVCERGYIRHNWFSAEWFSADGSGSFKSDRRESCGKRWEHYAALIEAIETGGNLTPNELDGLAYVRVQEAAMHSVRTGETVQL